MGGNETSETESLGNGEASVGAKPDSWAQYMYSHVDDQRVINPQRPNKIRLALLTGVEPSNDVTILYPSYLTIMIATIIAKFF
ncbi:unnamed protein product [Orchesella dallaii]|uniref:Uncharacterized protein n=1 Tax=Orchesella dallaii TaxID=48710 RepID=A0ABP1QJ52_9HEXA